MKIGLVLAALLGALLILGACADHASHSERAPEAPKEQVRRGTHQLRLASDYYLGGPQQGRPPEGQLPAGTQVSLIETEGSYSIVEVYGVGEGSFQAWVSSDSLAKVE